MGITITGLQASDVLTKRIESSWITVSAPDVQSKDEGEAIFSTWGEEYGDLRVVGDRSTFQMIPKTRRHFSLLPHVIRRAERLGYQIGIMLNEDYIREEARTVKMSGYYYDVFIDTSPQAFWKVISLMQVWFENATNGS